MKVVILCGGYGTRIRDVSDRLPKPMINIGPYPILFHIMKYYAAYGHKEFVLCLGYQSSVIKDFFLNLRAHTSDLSIDLKTGNHSYHSDHGDLSWNVTMAETGLETMTGGRIKKIQKYIGTDESFMLTYGDGVGDVDLNALKKFHESHGKTLTVTGVHPPGRFGELKANREGIVEEFNEKPQSSGGRISGGFFVCRRTLFDFIPDDDSCVFEQTPIRSIVQARQMAVYEHNGFWQPMDTHRDFILLNDLYGSGKAPWVKK